MIEKENVEDYLKNYKDVSMVETAKQRYVRPFIIFLFFTLIFSVLSFVLYLSDANNTAFLVASLSFFSLVTCICIFIDALKMIKMEKLRQAFIKSEKRSRVKKFLKEFCYDHSLIPPLNERWNADKEIVSLYLSHNPYAYVLISNELKSDPEIVHIIMVAYQKTIKPSKVKLDDTTEDWYKVKLDKIF